MDQNLDIFEQVFRLVVKEYQDGSSHNALGCEAWYDNRGFCMKSSYHPLHPSIDVLFIRSVLVMSCSSPLLYVTNVLYNFSNFGYDRLHL